MHISKVTIKNYRNFADFSMDFKKGLNVIIGSNNSGKTGLLYAIGMLNKPEIASVHDFNKNVIAQFATKFQEDAPEIVFEFEIRHEISEDNTEDESIVKLVPFLGLETIASTRKEAGEEKSVIYEIFAVVRMAFTLDVKALNDYRRDVKDINKLDDYVALLERNLGNYKWTFTNGTSEAESDKKTASGIFDIHFIGAERTSADVADELKREIKKISVDQSNALEVQKLKQALAHDIRKILDPTLERMTSLFKGENNEIGLNSGNVSIYHNIRPDIHIADAYITDVRDTKGNYVLPIEYNGLGYNNLINIYMLIKLNEVKIGKDFRILCLEEPEAHLHPAAQYKLFKFLKKLDETDKLNQQIFVTTHSSNISAVAGIDNMFMIDYVRNEGVSDCCQQSLELHFRDKLEAKNHLTKFLDVTRSDMLFADKVILVEGITEKLLLPLFMERCGYAYEDESISIVEIGGKHFEHFIELFNKNAVQKKVLCITDRDFEWIKKEDDKRTLAKYEEYTKSEMPHIKKLTEKFAIPNFLIETQSIGGRTFEDELFLTNLIADKIDDGKRAIELLEIVATDTVLKLIESHSLDFDKWDSNRPSANNSVVSSYLDIFHDAIIGDKDNTDTYRRLFFAELFLYYASTNKGNVALNILTNDSLVATISVPQYIQEGLEWLLK